MANNEHASEGSESRSGGPDPLPLPLPDYIPFNTLGEQGEGLKFSYVVVTRRTRLHIQTDIEDESKFEEKLKLDYVKADFYFFEGDKRGAFAHQGFMQEINIMPGLDLSNQTQRDLLQEQILKKEVFNFRTISEGHSVIDQVITESSRCIADPGDTILQNVAAIAVLGLANVNFLAVELFSGRNGYDVLRRAADKMQAYRDFYSHDPDILVTPMIIRNLYNCNQRETLV